MDKYLLNSLPNELVDLISSHDWVFGNLKSKMEIEVYKPKETILYFDRPVVKLRFLLRGKAKITLVHEDGKQSIVHFVQPNEFLGELSFLEIEKEPKNVVAVNECVFISVTMEQAKKELKADSEFLFRLGQMVGYKVLRRTYFSSKNQNYELKNRLAAYILLLENNGIYSEKHTETAEYLGVSYRHLLHTLKGFVDDGLIEKKGKGYSIDEEGLGKLAVNIEIV